MLKYINRNERKIEEDMVQTASFEERLELYKWLQGEKMEGYEINNQPKLNKEQAFAVIYMLQEAYGFIPYSFEIWKMWCMRRIIWFRHRRRDNFWQG